MKSVRRLSLRKEQLAELRSDEMADVVAGTAVTSVYGCRTFEVTCWGGCDRLTLPITQCAIQTD